MIRGWWERGGDEESVAEIRVTMSGVAWLDRNSPCLENAGVYTWKWVRDPERMRRLMEACELTPTFPALPSPR